VTGNVIINSQGQGDNPVCSTRDEIAALRGILTTSRHWEQPISLVAEAFVWSFRDVIFVVNAGQR